LTFAHGEGSASQVAVQVGGNHRHIMNTRSGCSELLTSGMLDVIRDLLLSERVRVMGVNQVFDETEFDLLTSTNIVASCPVLAQACIMQWSTADITLTMEEIMCPARVLWDKTADTMWTGINSALPMPIFTMASHCKFFVWVGSHDSIIANHRISNFVETASPANVFPFRMPCGSHKFVLCLIPSVQLCKMLNPMFACVKHLHISCNYERHLKHVLHFLDVKLVWEQDANYIPDPRDTDHLARLFELTLYKHDLTHNDSMDAEQLARILDSDKAFESIESVQSKIINVSISSYI
jgi:hypothetical protein